MDIRNSLEKLHLNQKQTELYFTLLQMGSGTIQEISQKAGLKRTTAYSILDNLIQRGFVTLSKKGAHRLYFAEDPQKLPRVLEVEAEAIKQRQRELLEVIPQLASLYNAHATKPQIKFYEGLGGLKQAFDETLELGAGEEILAYSSAESIHTYLGDYVAYYLSERVKRGISQRAIAEDSPSAREHLNNDQAERRTTRLVDKELYPFSNEINIFRNKTMIVSYRDLLGVVIESADIARTQKAIFELAWRGAGRLV
jgi:HTH-type transcriptional regulator, sugar sensing transcriptional regulator